MNRENGKHIARRSNTNDAVLQDLQKRAFRYFTRHVDAKTGLVLDSTQPGALASIAAVGFALSCYPVAVERGFIRRSVAIAHTLATLRFFEEADQSGAANGVGYKGFSIISWMCSPARALGRACCRRSTRPRCWPACFVGEAGGDIEPMIERLKACCRELAIEPPTADRIEWIECIARTALRAHEDRFHAGVSDNRVNIFAVITNETTLKP